MLRLGRSHLARLCRARKTGRFRAGKLAIARVAQGDVNGLCEFIESYHVAILLHGCSIWSGEPACGAELSHVPRQSPSDTTICPDASSRAVSTELRCHCCAASCLVMPMAAPAPCWRSSCPPSPLVTGHTAPPRCVRQRLPAGESMITGIQPRSLTCRPRTALLPVARPCDRYFWKQGCRFQQLCTQVYL